METVVVLSLIAIAASLAVVAYFTWLNSIAYTMLKDRVRILENESKVLKTNERLWKAGIDKELANLKAPKQTTRTRTTRRNAQ
jgi:hypothetical protein